MPDPAAPSDAPRSGVIARYGAYLPLTEATPRISLGEGDTPLVRAPSLEEATGAEVHLKLESTNPSGSFKDRGMVVAVAKALEEGATAVMCASTGNTSASAAAYAARYGLRCYVIVPRGNIAQGKLAQAIVHGARILSVDGSFDDALTLAQQITKRRPITLVNSVNPHRIAGQKTAALEIVDALGDAPDLHCIPVGNAGNITAYWAGYREYYQAEEASRTPRMFGFQAAGAAPLVQGRTGGTPGDRRDRHPDRQACLLGGRDPGARRVRRCDPGRQRRADSGCLSAPRPRRGRLLRARFRGLGRGAAFAGGERC